MLTLLAVFKDLLPAYRIRPVVDKEEGAGKASDHELPNTQRYLCGACHGGCMPTFSLTARTKLGFLCTAL